MWIAADPGRPALRLRPRQGQPDPRRTRATRTRTATASARCPAAASRCASATPCAPSPRRRRRPPSSSPGGCRRSASPRPRRSTNDSQLTEIIGKGDYDMFVWGWTPFVDPDPMLSYFTCGQVSQDPKDPTNYYNDANWCDHDLRRALQAAERRAQPRQAHARSSTRCSRASTSPRPTSPLYRYPDLQAYRKGRFTGWIRQPAKTGPVLFTNSSQTYFDLKPVAASSGGGGAGRPGAMIGIVVAARSSCSAASASARAPAERRRARMTRG